MSGIFDSQKLTTAGVFDYQVFVGPAGNAASSATAKGLLDLLGASQASAMILPRTRYTTQPQSNAKLDWSHPLTKGLSHFWGLNQLGSRALMDSVSGLTGQFGVGVPSTLSGNAWVPTESGHAIKFDTTGSGIASSIFLNLGSSTGSGAPKASNSFTLFARVKLGSLTNQSIYSSSTGSGSIQFRVESTGAIGLLSSGVAGVSSTAGVVTAGKFYNIAVTYDGATASFFVDGRLINQGAFVRTFSLARQYALGAHYAAETIGNGSIVQVFGFYDRVLSTTEATRLTRNYWDLFSKPVQVLPLGATSVPVPDLVGSGQAVADSSGTIGFSADISGSGQALATSTGNVSQPISMGASGSSVATGGGGVTQSLGISGVSIASATGAGIVNEAMSVSGSAASVVISNGLAVISMGISGNAPVIATGSGQVNLMVNLSSSAISAALATASMAALGNGLEGSAQANSQSTGGLTTHIPILGSSAAQTTGSGGLTTRTPIAGSSAAQATMAGSVGASTSLAGVSLAVSSSVGDVVTVSLGGLTGQALANATSGGSLNLSVTLSASALAQAISHAQVTEHGVYQLPNGKFLIHNATDIKSIRSTN